MWAAGRAMRSPRVNDLLPIETAVAATTSETVSVTVAISSSADGAASCERLFGSRRRETGLAGQLCHGGRLSRIMIV